MSKRDAAHVDIRTVQQLMSHSDEPEQAWLIDNLLRDGGQVVLAGAPKSGKSFFAFHSRWRSRRALCGHNFGEAGDGGSGSVLSCVSAVDTPERMSSSTLYPNSPYFIQVSWHVAALRGLPTRGALYAYLHEASGLH